MFNQAKSFWVNRTIQTYWGKWLDFIKYQLKRKKTIQQKRLKEAGNVLWACKTQSWAPHQLNYSFFLYLSLSFSFYFSFFFFTTFLDIYFCYSLLERVFLKWLNRSHEKKRLRLLAKNIKIDQMILQMGRKSFSKWVLKQWRANILMNRRKQEMEENILETWDQVRIWLRDSDE